MTIIQRTPEQLKEEIKSGSYITRCMLYGRSGSGKSTMASTFPGKKGIIDTDSGAISYSSSKDCSIYTILEDSNISNMKPEAWLDAVKVLNELITDNTIKTIIIDSFTTLADACLKYILGTQNKTIQAASFVDWGRQMDLLTNFLFRAFSSRKNVIGIFHEEMTKDELTGQTWCSILITGKLSEKMPDYFDEVYHLETTRKGNETVYQARTRATNLYVAKSRLSTVLNLPEFVIPSNFNQIFKGTANGNV